MFSAVVMVAVSAAGCGLSDASTRACSAGKALAARVNERIEEQIPRSRWLATVIVGEAKAVEPTFKELVAQADDEDVKAALTDLSKIFADFNRDVSPKLDDTFAGDHEFAGDVAQFKTALNDHTDKLNAACA